MSKEIDPLKADEWSDDEFKENMTYLESRGRTYQASQAREVRGVDEDTEESGQMSMSDGSELPEGFDEFTAKEVDDWVDGDQTRAGIALAEEMERDEPRVTLTKVLEKLANGE